MYYFQEEYTQALFYYEKYIAILEANKVDMYPAENIKIAYTYRKTGNPTQAQFYLKKYKAYLERDKSIYKQASLAMLYLYENKYDEAIKAYDAFSMQNDFQFWLLLFIKEDPLFRELQSHPKYEETIQKIEEQFWSNHKRLKETLLKEKLL